MIPAIVDSSFSLPFPENRSCGCSQFIVTIVVQQEIDNQPCCNVVEKEDWAEKTVENTKLLACVMMVYVYSFRDQHSNRVYRDQIVWGRHLSAHLHELLSQLGRDASW